MKKEKMLQRLSTAIDELDKDLFMSILSPFSCYNNTIRGGIDTFAFNNEEYERGTNNKSIIELYDTLISMEEDIDELVRDITADWMDMEEDEDGNDYSEDDWMENYIGPDWLPIVRFFITGELNKCGYYRCTPNRYKGVMSEILEMRETAQKYNL